MNKLHTLAPVLGALVIAGCATPPPIDTSALPQPAAAFREDAAHWTVAPPAETQERGAWWRVFKDSVLNDLVERAAHGNNDVRLAAARVTQARALVRATDADRLPQAGAGVGATRGTLPLYGGAVSSVYTGGANASYEVDLVGRLARTTEAAQLDEQAREALLQNSRLLVQADVAQAYLSLLFLDAERRIVRDTVLAYDETLRLTERRQQAGDVAALDVARVRAEASSTEAEAYALDRRRSALEHALAVLLGENPSNFSLPEAEMVTVLPVIPPGVPSTVLARRPDVAAAQRSMLASQARVGVAQAAWFPSLALTANGGYASTDLGDLFKWSARTWSVSALLSLPLFDGGRRRAGVENAQGELDAALAQYRQQILVAFQDVEDQLSALRYLAQQSRAQSDAVESASRATTLSAVRYRNGYVSQLELLDAQRSELRDRRQAVQVHAAQYLATVGLVRALGGGWDDASIGPSASR